MLNPTWMLAALAALVPAAALGLGLWAYRQRRHASALSEWALAPRPLFSPSERLMYRQLRDALPHHVVLAKVPLLRFCRPTEASQQGYWHRLLGPVYVSFVVCSPGGRVLAALDVESPKRPVSRRLITIKQEVLRACHIRFVRCNAEQLPTITELQLLVPPQGQAGRASVPGTLEIPEIGRQTLAHAVRARAPMRATPTWSDSAIATDSFFAPDSRIDEFGASVPPGLGVPAPVAAATGAKAAPRPGSVRVAEPAPGGLLSLGPGLRSEDTLQQR